MWRYRMDVEYDGTDFSGWQVQPGRRTAQGELARMTGRLGAEGFPTGSGRTDAGVHALANTAHCDLPREWDAEELHRALRALAPSDLAIHRVVPVTTDFHARFGAIRRSYVYALGRDMSVFHRNRRWVPPTWPDADWMRRELKSLHGDRDCASLARTGSDTKTTRCLITDTAWTEFPGGATVSVTANRFLYGMIRAMVGSLVRGAAENGSDWMTGILDHKDRSAAGEAAPAAGLYLVAVEYPGDESPERAETRVARVAGIESKTMSGSPHIAVSHPGAPQPGKSEAAS